MIAGLRVLAVIPARAGSKRCPAKNIRDFRGKPLVQWTLECARASKYLDVIACSTDCPTVAMIAWQQGAVVIPRPAELATDEAKSEDVLRHALGLIPADIVVLLQPTSPLRIAEDVEACIDRATASIACARVNGFRRCLPVLTAGPDGRRNGAVYAMPAGQLAAGDNFDHECLDVRMPASRSLDIDHPQDFDWNEQDPLPGYIS